MRPTTTEAPRALRRDLAPVLIALTAVGIGLTHTDHAAVLPVLIDEFDLDNVRAGLLSTALFGTGLLFIPAGAFAGDRVRPKTLVSSALVLALAGNVVLAVAPSFMWMLVGKSISGIAPALSFPASVRYLSRRYSHHGSNLQQSVYGAGYSIGAAAALWGTAPIAAAFGWRIGIHACTAAILLILLVWQLAPGMEAEHAKGSPLDALLCRTCWVTALQHAAGFGAVLAASSWMTVFLVASFALDLGTAGVIASGVTLFVVVGRLLGGAAAARGRLTARAAMCVGPAVSMMGLLVLLIPARPLALAVAGIVLLGVGAGIPYTAIFQTASVSLPSAPSAGVALTSAGGTLGALVGAPALGYAVQESGFPAAWLLLVALSALAALSTLSLPAKVPLPSPHMASDLEGP